MRVTAGFIFLLVHPSYPPSSGEEIRLPISPGKSAADEAQALYARVRKLRRSVDALKPLLEKVRVDVWGRLSIC